MLTSKIVSLNNEGVAMFNRGGHMAALSIFRQASNAIREKVEEAEGNATKIESDSGEITGASTMHFGALERIQIPSQEEATSPHNRFCLFGRTLCLKLDPGNFDRLDETFLSAVLLFNMAITCHHVGLTKNGSFLIQAMDIYKMILMISEDVDESTSIFYKLYMKVVIMAVFSNLGHIYSHWFKAAEVAICRKHLRLILSGGDQLLELLDYGEYMVFFLNSAHEDGGAIDWAAAA